MTSVPRMYGITNCDTIKKAKAWLADHKVAYTFHDYKTAGVDRERLETWVREHGWEILLNRAGTTFRKVLEADKRNLTERKAIALMLAEPSMIKRPVLEVGKRSVIGFSPERYAEIFNGGRS